MYLTNYLWQKQKSPSSSYHECSQPTVSLFLLLHETWQQTRMQRAKLNDKRSSPQLTFPPLMLTHCVPPSDVYSGLLFCPAFHLGVFRTPWAEGLIILPSTSSHIQLILGWSQATQNWANTDNRSSLAPFACCPGVSLQAKTNTAISVLLACGMMAREKPFLLLCNSWLHYLQSWADSHIKATPFPTHLSLCFQIPVFSAFEMDDRIAPVKRWVREGLTVVKLHSWLPSCRKIYTSGPVPNNRVSGYGITQLNILIAFFDKAFRFGVNRNTPTSLLLLKTQQKIYSNSIQTPYYFKKADLAQTYWKKAPASETRKDTQ